VTCCAALVCLLVLLAPPALAGQKNAPDLKIPAARCPKWNPGIAGGIPDVPVKATVKSGADAATIQRAIASVKVPGAVFLPAGTYRLELPLQLKSGVVLRGAGMAKTHLRFEFKEKPRAAINLRGRVGSVYRDKSGKSADVFLASGYTPGSTKLIAAGPTKLHQGQYVALICENHEATHNAGGNWLRVSGGAYARYHIVGQVLRLKKVTGRELEVDRPVRLGYFRKERKPRLRPLKMIERAGVEDLHVRAGRRGGHIFDVYRAADCWIRRCHSEYASKCHVRIAVSRGVTVRDGLMHHAHGYGGGGQGYGVWLGYWSTDCLVENNAFYHLRHAMLTTLGANGNVFGYNASRGCKRNCDISLHGFYSYMNLFEGNTVVNVDYSDYWGPVGPGNTCYRNRVTRGGIQVKNRTHYSNVVANTMMSRGISVAGGVRGTHIEKNLYAGRRRAPGIDGLSLSCPAPEWKIPASLYLERKPAFWGKRPWPGIGAEVDLAALRVKQKLPPTPAEKLLKKNFPGGGGR
jgi:hypothetical protein